MGKITFISTAGKLPITAELIGSGLAPVIVYAHNTQYSFENVPLGDYTLLLTGDDGCYNSTEVVMSDYEGEWVEYECVEITTTTTSTIEIFTACEDFSPYFETTTTTTTVP